MLGKMLSKRALLLFIAETFGPLIVFYGFEHTLGLKAAIIAGLVTGVISLAFELARTKRFSAMTAYVTVSLVVFGYLDLRYATSGLFLELEPVFGGVAIALFFLGSSALGRPVMVELAEKQIGRSLPPKARPYVARLNMIWGLFFLARAGLYLWLSFRLSLDAFLGWRLVIGNSWIGLLGIEMLYRRWRFGQAAMGGTPESAPPTT